MDNKKKFAAICIGFLILSASVGTTLAYLGDKDDKTNTIKVGTDIAEVSETDWSEPEYQTQENTNDKTITVKNKGSVPCFVRVYAEFSDSEIADIAKVNNNDTQPTTYTDWDDFKSAKDITKNSSITDDWVYIPESGPSGLGGYFYYTKVVPVGDATTSLIKKVQVNYKTDNIDEIRDYEMIVYTETVQTVDTDGTDYAAQGVTDGWKKAWERFLKKTTPTP